MVSLCIGALDSARKGLFGGGDGQGAVVVTGGNQ